MIRTTIIFACFGVLMLIAIKRWYLALAGLVVLTVLAQHPEMPRQLFGIQGLNPWNATLLVIVVSWLFHRRSEEGGPGAPAGPRPLGGAGSSPAPGLWPSAGPWAGPSPLLLFICAADILLIAVCGLAGARDAGSVKGSYSSNMDFTGILVDGVINPLKYVLVGILFYAGAIDRQRVWLALFSAVGSGLCYAGLLLKSMKLRVFTIDYLDARRLGDKLIGVFANDLGQNLAFTIFAALIITYLLKRRWQRLAWLSLTAAAVPCFVAMKSRAGYLAFCTTGLALGLLRWRRLLFLVPLGILLVVFLDPSVSQRALTGLGGRSYSGQEVDWDELSAGRVTNIWPPTLAQIRKSPWIGHGRYEILRGKCYEQILELEGKVPTHPHSAYLEVLLDAGVVGLLISLGFMAVIVCASLSLMRAGEPFLVTAGTVSLAAATVMLTACLSGYSFFPSETTVPYVAVWGAALRIWDQRRSARRVGIAGPPNSVWGWPPPRPIPGAFADRRG
jgi:O-antigen ligase